MRLNQLLETEVVLMVEVVDNVRHWDILVMHAQGIRRHQLHQLLTEKANKKLCQSRDYEQSIDGDILEDADVWVRVVEGIKRLHHSSVDVLCAVVVRFGRHAEHTPSKFSITHDLVEDLPHISLQFYR